MPDAGLPGARRARSLTIAGGLDVALGLLGLSLATLLALVAGMLLWIVALAKGWNSLNDFRTPAEAMIAVSGGVALGGILPLASVLADALLVVTGVRLLARSRGARRAAIAYACLIIPFGVVDLAIVRHSPIGGPILWALALFSPIHAIAQLAAFFILPSWRALAAHSGTVAPATR